MRPIEIPSPDAACGEAARSRQQQLTKPPGSLGRLEDLACWVAARLHNPVPTMPRCEIFVFAADHGVAARGVSAFPQSVTGQMLGNFACGGAAINVLASLESCRIEVVDVGVVSPAALPPGIRRESVRPGTRDLSVEAAMTEDELSRALDVGARCAREAVERGARLLIAGDMGIANTTSAACLICALTGVEPERVVGRGTGLDDPGLARKRTLVAESLARAMESIGTTAAELNRLRLRGEAASLAWRLLAQVGGLEIAAMAGFYLEAARLGAIALLDGYISTSAALTAAALQPPALLWMLASHRSAEAGHAVALAALRLEPLIDLGMRLGEGSGAALTVPIIRAALSLHRNMATFSEAGVAKAVDPDSVATQVSGGPV